ncbi:benzoyl-CoA oxygenase, partial [Burkholderia sp. SIMBA_019]
VPPCPTGSIDNWRLVLRSDAYSVQDQLGWDELPREQPLPEAAAIVDEAANAVVEPVSSAAVAAMPSVTPGASVPPWSAAHPYVNLYTHKTP